MNPCYFYLITLIKNSKMLISLLGQVYKIKFWLDSKICTGDAEMNWVLNNQPWHFEGCLFSIRPLKETEQPSKILITKTHIWVRVYDAPVCYWKPHMVKATTNKIGSLVSIDSSHNFYGKHLNLRWVSIWWNSWR